MRNAAESVHSILSFSDRIIESSRRVLELSFSKRKDFCDVNATKWYESAEENNVSKRGTDSRRYNEESL